MEEESFQPTDYQADKEVKSFALIKSSFPLKFANDQAFPTQIIFSV